jgi:hypothetical protein
VPKMNQKLAKILSHISPNILFTCSENHRQVALFSSDVLCPSGKTKALRTAALESKPQRSAAPEKRACFPRGQTQLVRLPIARRGRDSGKRKAKAKDAKGKGGGD